MNESHGITGCISRRSAPPPARDTSAAPAWQSRAIPEGRGEIRVLPDGRREALRYAGWTKRDFGAFRTYAYGETRPEPAVTKATPPPGVPGDAKRGRALFRARDKGPCTGCHLVPGDDVWPAGNVGPDLSTIADRHLTADYLYQLVYDARVIFPSTVMPPWGTTKVFTPAQIVDVVAYLQTLKGPKAAEKNVERDPATRPTPVGYYGDNLDPTTNPAVAAGEDAEALWKAAGPSGKSCASCHEGGAARAMRGVATRYPKFVKARGRVMSVEDFLTVHGPETTGRALPAESAENLALTLHVKMASNGLPVAVDLASPEARAAWASATTPAPTATPRRRAPTSSSAAGGSAT